MCKSRQNPMGARGWSTFSPCSPLQDFLRFGTVLVTTASPEFRASIGAGSGLLSPHHSGLRGGRMRSWGGAVGFHPGCEPIRSASSIVIPVGMVLNRNRHPSCPSRQAPMRISPFEPGRGIVLKTSIRFRAANRRSSMALAAARDCGEPIGYCPRLAPVQLAPWPF